MLYKNKAEDAMKPDSSTIFDSPYVAFVFVLGTALCVKFALAFL